MAPPAARVMRPERWQLLLRTAAAEFAAAGYEQASLNRIIRACGMSKSSFYHYIRSKQELFERVVDEFAAALVEQVEVPSPDDFVGDFWACAGGFLDRLAALAEREPPFTDLGRMFYLPGAPTGQHTAVGRAVTAAQTWLEQTLAVGREVGAVRDDLPAELQGQVTIAVLRAFDEWSLRHRAELSPQQTRELVRAQLDALERLLAPQPPAGRGHSAMRSSRVSSTRAEASQL